MTFVRRHLMTIALAGAGLLVAVLAVVVSTRDDDGRSAAPDGVVRPGASAPEYRKLVLADKPLAYWRLNDEDSATQKDETTGGHAGKLIGDPVFTGGAVIGDENDGLSFDGDDDEVLFDGRELNFGTGDLTIEAWIRTTVNGGQSIAGKQASPGPFWNLTVANDPGNVGRIRATFSDGRTTRQAFTARRVDDGMWHHVAVTYRRTSGATLFVDGARIYRDATLPGSLSNTAPLRLGRVAAQAPFRGDLDEVAIYRRALPAAAIARHHAEGTRAEGTTPAPTLSAPPATTTDPTPRYAGTAGTARGDRPSVRVEIFRGRRTGGSPLRSPSIIPSADGKWSLEDGAALEQGTYTVRASQADTSGNVGRSSPRTFQVSTPAAPANDPTLTAVGDILGCGSSGDEATAALLAKQKGAIQTLGDNAYPDGSPEAFACFDASWGRFKARIHPSLGDHEYELGNADPYFAYFGAAAGDTQKGYYSYDVGSWHVVVTNPNCDHVPGGCGAGSPQETWLRDDLAAHPVQCTIGVVGSPRFSSGSVHGPQTAILDLWKALYVAGADVVLAGDDHHYERFAPQNADGMSDPQAGTRQFIVGTGGYSLYPLGATQSLSETRSNAGYGMLRLTLHPGSYEWQYVPVAGNDYTDAGSSPCT